MKYLFNKSIFKTSLDVISYTRAGNKTTSFDDYSFWDDGTIPYGRSAILASYQRPSDAGAVYHLLDDQRETVRANIEQNILETARANPQIEFLLFFPPYSMFYWDKQHQLGTIDQRLEAEREAIELMLSCDNIRLFSFLDDFELANDFGRFKDYIHYDSEVNSWMLRCMASGEHELTQANYEDYCARMYDYLSSYDYGALFEP